LGFPFTQHSDLETHPWRRLRRSVADPYEFSD
jgi:hypothetical protein